MDWKKVVCLGGLNPICWPFMLSGCALQIGPQEPRNENDYFVHTSSDSCVGAVEGARTKAFLGYCGSLFGEIRGRIDPEIKSTNDSDGNFLNCKARIHVSASQVVCNGSD